VPLDVEHVKKPGSEMLQDHAIIRSMIVSVVGNDDATESRRQKLENWIREKAKKSFTKKVLYKRMPILSWLPKYNAQDAVGDLVAGITVGLTVIPQSLAYANVAGLPTEVCYHQFFTVLKYLLTVNYTKRALKMAVDSKASSS
jgi:hypothetical protein